MVRAMKAVSVLAVLLLLAVNAAALLVVWNIVDLPAAYVPAANAAPLTPAAVGVLPYVLIATLVLGLLALVTVLGIAPRVVERTVVAEAARPMPAPPKANQAESEIVSFLACCRRRAGWSISSWTTSTPTVTHRSAPPRAWSMPDASPSCWSTSASARCAKRRGIARVSVPADYPPDEYRLLGKISGQAPFSGVLVHHGWKTEFVKLPTILRGSGERLPAIAPAEVELK